MTKTLLHAAVLVIALSLTACPSNPPSGPTAAATSPQARRTVSAGPTCDVAERRMFRWFPHDLPLPRGTRASLGLAGSAGLHRGILIVPLSIRPFHHFISAKWPPAGYVLGRVAVGSRRFSGSFVKGPARGSFVVRVACPRVLQLYLGYTAGSSSPSAS
ncbi:MAG TPA: hypothetical protein VHV50_13255 [Actinomycetota bacterium]|nr:hypothetical protein [Actinomycetota bacterium]